MSWREELAAAVGAAAAAVGLARLLGTAHPLGPTAAVFLAATVVLAVLARRLGRPFGSGLAIGGLAIVCLAAAAPSLGVPGLQQIVMVGLLVTLGSMVFHLLPALRPRLGAERQRLRRPDWVFAAVPFVVYLVLIPWTAAQRPPDGDEPYYLLIAHSLVHDFDVDLTNNYENGDSLQFMPRRLEPQLGDPKGRDGHWFSRHDLLFPALATLPYALGGKIGVLVLMAGLAAALGWWTLRLARHLPGSTDGLFRAWCLMMFCSPLVIYSHQVWIEVPAALLLVIALDGILALNGSLPPRRLAFGVVGPILLLVPLKLRLALLAGPLALLLWWRSGRSIRLGAIVGLPLLALSAALLAFNSWFFGRALKVYEIGDLGLLQPPLLRYAQHLVGLFFDLSFGLFALTPIWLVLIPAGVLAWKRRDPTLGHLLIVAGPYFFLLLSRREWYGGWSPAFRYGLVLLPLLTLLLAPALDRARGAGWRLLGASTGLVTAGTLGAGLVVPGWTFNFADGSSRLADLAMSRFGVDLVRFLPSGIRERPATWWFPLAATVLVLLVVRWHGGGRSRPIAAALGCAVALLVPLVLVGAGASVPTRVIEAEDRWLRADDGSPHPSLWTPDRARFRGGWALPAGSSLTVPVVVGGRAVHTVALLRPGFNTDAQMVAELWAGEQLVAEREIAHTDQDQWLAVDFGENPWPAKTPMTFTLRRTDHRRLRNFVVIDRIDLTWR